MATVYTAQVTNPHEEFNHLFVEPSEVRLQQALEEFYEGDWEDGYDSVEDYLRDLGIDHGKYEI